MPEATLAQSNAEFLHWSSLVCHVKIVGVVLVSL